MFERTSEVVHKFMITVGAVSTFITACAAIYGIWFVLPNFIKQKRLENFSNNAAKSLEDLVKIEESLRKLIIITNKPCDSKEHLAVQLEVSHALNDLKSRLLLLRTFRQVLNIIPWVDELRKTLNHIFETENTKEASGCAIDEFTKYWKSSSELNFKRIDELREILLNIFEIKEKEQVGILKIS